MSFNESSIGTWQWYTANFCVLTNIYLWKEKTYSFFFNFSFKWGGGYLDEGAPIFPGREWLLIIQKHQITVQKYVENYILTTYRVQKPIKIP